MTGKGPLPRPHTCMCELSVNADIQPGRFYEPPVELPEVAKAFYSEDRRVR